MKLQIKSKNDASPDPLPYCRVPVIYTGLGLPSLSSALVTSAQIPDQTKFAYESDSNIPYPTAFPYGNGMVLHFYQQQESSTTKTVHKVINKGLKAYV